jgi:hypothetical protein
MRRGLWGAGALALLLAGSAGPLAGQQSHLLVIGGLGGEPEYSEAFHAWGTALVDAARTRYGLPASNIVYLAERPERDPSRIRARSTRENVEQAFRDLAARAAPGDQVLVVLIGHGSFEAGEARFNLPGRDLTAADFARLVGLLSAQKVAFVNTASASGPFVEALSGRNRVVVAATKTGAERNATRFGRYLVEALASEGADTDKDGRVSLLEAFEYARREVARSYEAENRLLTEHAVLDDDGDGVGSAEPGRAGSDGSLARTFFLRGGAGEVVLEATDPELRTLLERRRSLEARIEALKAERATMDAERYEAELEKLLLELARTNQAIRRQEASKP